MAKRLMDEAIEENTIIDILFMAKHASWTSIQTTRGNKEDADRDKEQFNYYANKIKESGYFTNDLVESMKWCAYDMGWYYANMASGDKQSAQNDLKKA